MGSRSPSSVLTVAEPRAESAPTSTGFGSMDAGFSVANSTDIGESPPATGIRKPWLSSSDVTRPWTIAYRWRKDSFRGPRRRTMYSPVHGDSYRSGSNT